MKKNYITKVLTFATILSFIFIKSYSQVTYTFTTAGATGVNGPTQGQLNSAYASTNLNGLVTSVSGIQQWTVPVSGNYRIETYGAQGGNGGGLGAKMVGEFNLSAGTVLKIVVGQQGLNVNSSSNSGGGGGGGSFVTNTANSIFVIAGGGGGFTSAYGGYIASYSPIISGGQTGQSGGSTNLGGGGTGGNGGQHGTNDCCLTNGSSGGGGFSSNGVAGGGGTAGLAFVNGATGGTGQPNGFGGFGGGSGCAYDNAVRAGAGGGYSGGQGGAFTYPSPLAYTHGGGGGSINNGINQVNVANFNSGDGRVVIVNLFGLAIAQTSSIACNGLSTAALSTTVTGGVGPYTYSWMPTGGTSSSASGLAAGTYSCRVTDANLLVTINTFTVTQPAVLSSIISSQTNVTCNGGNNGALTVAPSGGTAPYSYTWSPSGGNLASASGLIAGSYTCSIKDANNCAIIQQAATVTQAAAFTVSGNATNSVICNGFSTVLSGSGATTYTWTGGITNGVSFSPISTIAYSLTGSNALGCLSSNTAVVTVTVNPRPTISVNSGSICVGQTFVMVPTGASTYTFQGGNASVSPLTSTNYTVAGTSALGCLSSNTVTSAVVVNTVPIVSVNSGVICSGQSFTMIPAGAATYTFSNGNTVVSPLANTSYSLVGTSAQGCVSSNTAVSTVTVNITPTISVNSGAICTGQSFTLNPSGATTYTYSSGNSVVSPIITTSYSVTGTSAQGCVSSNTAVSSVTANVTPTLSVNSGSICSGLSFTMVPAGAFSYTYSSGSAVVAPLANAVYSVTGTSAQGCAASNTAVSAVLVSASPTLVVNSGAICLGNSFTLTPSGASTYTFSNGSSTVSPTASSNYSVTGTSTAGCVSSNTAVSSVTVNPLPVIVIAGVNSICIGNSTSLTASGATSYTWNTSASTASIAMSPTVSTTYSVGATDSNGCYGTASQTVVVNALPIILANSSNSIICLGETTSLTASGATIYAWSSSTQSTSVIAISPSVTTSYSVVGTDANGCINSAVVTQSVAACTSVKAIANSLTSEISIFPNPNNGEFFISTSVDLTISIVNDLGQTVKVLSLNQANNRQISVTDLANGIYFVIAQNNNQVVKQKLIIAK